MKSNSPEEKDSKTLSKKHSISLSKLNAATTPNTTKETTKTPTASQLTPTPPEIGSANALQKKRSLKHLNSQPSLTSLTPSETDKNNNPIQEEKDNPSFLMSSSNSSNSGPKDDTKNAAALKRTMTTAATSSTTTTLATSKTIVNRGSQIATGPKAPPISATGAAPPIPSPAQTPAASAQFIVIKFLVTSLGVQKALRCNTTDTVWSVKKQLLEKVGNDITDFYNCGLYMPGSGGKQGKFMEEKRQVHWYKVENNVTIELIPKTRQGGPSANVDEDTPGSPSANSKKKQKKFLEDVQKGNVDKAKEKLLKGLDPNFWSETEETPLSIAIMNNDKDMIILLVEQGAFIDYRVGPKDSWKTPLHIAAQHNKPQVLQLLLSFGAWVNAVDILGLTPLTYATSSDATECVHRLLLARADMEICDENKKCPLHQACLNDNEYIVWLLVDFGADTNAQNISGNTALHVAATRNAIKSAKKLLVRGVNREITNKAGQTPANAAATIGNGEISELIKNFKDEDIIPIPPPPSYTESAEYPFNISPPYYTNLSLSPGSLGGGRPISESGDALMNSPNRKSFGAMTTASANSNHSRTVTGDRSSTHSQVKPLASTDCVTEVSEKDSSISGSLKSRTGSLRKLDSPDSSSNPYIGNNNSPNRKSMMPNKIPPPPPNAILGPPLQRESTKSRKETLELNEALTTIRGFVQNYYEKKDDEFEKMLQTLTEMEQSIKTHKNQAVTK